MFGASIAAKERRKNLHRLSVEVLPQEQASSGVGFRVLLLSVGFVTVVKRSNNSVKFVPAFGLHGTRRKRRAPYLKR
jgi:hypothetical protein